MPTRDPSWHRFHGGGEVRAGYRPPVATVAVLGGGVGGLSAAHELAERGFDVTVYEARDTFGGKARSLPVPQSGKQRGDGRVEGILSVDVSEWERPGRRTGKVATACSREEIRAEVSTRSARGRTARTR
jgi:NADPH-dependent 2,4-dienoyl-CoA reductase/sulfur reductase-like enzyme